MSAWKKGLVGAALAALCSACGAEPVMTGGSPDGAGSMDAVVTPGGGQAPVGEGGSGSTEEGSGSSPGEVPAEQSAGASTAKETFELRLLGLPAAGSLWLGVKAVNITVDGKPLEVELDAGPFDLGNTQHAWRVARFHAPQGAKKVVVSVQLDEAGEFRQGESKAVVDLRGPAITFESPLTHLRLRGRAVIHLDVAGSLHAQGKASVLLPRLGIYY
jgi:hypothetical protein